MTDVIPCACGCGQTLTALDSRGRPRNYIPGHYWRGRERPARRKERPTWSAAHAYARRRVRQRKQCELAHIGHCFGRLDVAHLDQNHHNTAPSNLMTLCRSHHFLYDHGRIDMSNPVLPAFYVDISGKRCYLRAKARPRETENALAA